jgi:hypothetical protein
VDAGLVKLKPVGAAATMNVNARVCAEVTDTLTVTEFPLGQVHTSVTAYVYAAPGMALESKHDVEDRDGTAHVVTDVEAGEPVIDLDTFQEEKLQYEALHEFAPAVQLTNNDAGAGVDEGADVPVPEGVDTVKLKGLAATTRAGLELAVLLNVVHEQASTTVYTYALLVEGVESMHWVNDLEFNEVGEHALETDDDTPLTVLVTVQPAKEHVMPL